MNKKVLEFTYAEYSPETPYVDLSMIALSFIPHLIPIVALSFSVALKERQNVFFFIGLVMTHEIAKLLKIMVKQPRPSGSYMTSYGMPSDHSQFMFFSTSYLISVLLSKPWIRKQSVIVSSLLMILLSTSVCYSRLYLGAHSLQQVLVGAILGIFLGRMWYLFTTKVLVPSVMMKTAFNRVYSALGHVLIGRTDVKKLS
jgi:dolichyldiphosphatase